MRSIVVKQAGPPEVMKLSGSEDVGPPPGNITVRVEAAGVNFIDIYHRSGQYPIPTPFTPGLEGAGTVAAVGEGVSEFKPGDTVAWCEIPGSYSDLVVGPAERFVAVPDGISTQSAAAVMLQGLTAHYLSHDVHLVKPGETVLIHAAAGGVGLLLTQMVKSMGGKVIGTTSTEAKADVARANGCDVVFAYRGFKELVMEYTNDKGVNAVYDGVGKTTFDDSLSCLALRGSMVLFGQSSGAVAPIDPQRLNAAGSVSLHRPKLFDFIPTVKEFRDMSGLVFAAIKAGDLAVRIGATYDLRDAAKAHKALDARDTTGKVLLIPEAPLSKPESDTTTDLRIFFLLLPLP